MTKIKWLRGSAAKSDAYTGSPGEIVIDTTNHRIRVQDGETAGGSAIALKSDLPTKLSQLTDDVGVWKRTELTKVSQLTNDSGFWSKSSLTKTSQLTNDSGYKTGHCSYCTHCSYCNQCGNCYNCTTVNCTTVNCTTVKCSVYDDCSYCSGNCSSDCSQCDCCDN